LETFSSRSGVVADATPGCAKLYEETLPNALVLSCCYLGSFLKELTTEMRVEGSGCW